MAGHSLSIPSPKHAVCVRNSIDTSRLVAPTNLHVIPHYVRCQGPRIAVGALPTKDLEITGEEDFAIRQLQEHNQ
jgi:hypothetical protein